MAERSSTATIVIVVLLLVGVLLLLPMFGMWMIGPMMMGGGMMGGWRHPFGAGWSLMLGGMLIPFLFIVLLVVGAYFLLTPRGQRVETERALAILNERYAKGELSKEQYLEMRGQLTKK